MNHDMHVISLATTGPGRFPDDEVVEIAICGVDTNILDMDCVYSSTIALESDHWTEERRRFVMENYGLGREELDDARDAAEVVHEVKELLHDQVVTSFDIKADFYGFLLNLPWDLTGEVSIAPSISTRSAEVCRIPYELREGGNILNLTYDLMFPHDPVRVQGCHRPLDDAMRASAILLELRRIGRY